MYNWRLVTLFPTDADVHCSAHSGMIVKSACATPLFLLKYDEASHVVELHHSECKQCCCFSNATNAQLVISVLECKHVWACLQMCILDGNAYDAKCLEAGQEREEDLDGCSLLLNNKVHLSSTQTCTFTPSCHDHIQLPYQSTIQASAKAT